MEQSFCLSLRSTKWLNAGLLSSFFTDLLLAMVVAAGLLRLKGAYDTTGDLEEMKREKDEADREPRVSIFSLVKGRVNTSPVT